MKISAVAVVGAGTMGNGIAHSFAQHGFWVTLIDVSPEQLEKAKTAISRNLDRMVTKGLLQQEQKLATLSRLSWETSLSKGVQQADLIVEAVSERQDLKQNLFRDFDSLAPQHCILASNTSSLSITALAQQTRRPDKVIGMHFMNPVPVMKLVEIIQGKQTSPQVTEAIVRICEQLGKTPCVVHDAPGFIANRILLPMLNEAVYCLQEGIAGVEAIDTIMRLGMSHPMGPLQLADFIGIDVCLSILQVIQEGFNSPKYQPCPLWEKLVKAQQLGVKSGKGFYVYDSFGKPSGVNPLFQ